MEIPVVETLPVLNQADFPPLPQIPDDTSLVCCNTEWQNAEKEFTAGTIITACIKAKMWQPIAAHKFIACLNFNPVIPPPAREAMAKALWTLVEVEFVSVIRYQEMSYFVPTPRFAQIALPGSRYVTLD